MKNMKKYLVVFLIINLLFGCNKKEEVTEETITEIPKKEEVNNTLASKSGINTSNIEEYLFRDDCIYIDTRSALQFYEEGHIAGFVNIPFYGYITDFGYNENTLFQMDKIKEGDNIIQLGDIGSYSENYEESIELIKSIIPSDKYVLVISTGGVESSYFLNLLIQIGYDGSKLYNIGSYINGFGDDIAYISLKDNKYNVEGITLFDTEIEYKLDGLTKIEK